MVKFKKTMAKAMAAAMVLGMTAVAAPVAAPAVTAFAAEEAASARTDLTITVDYANYTAFIETKAKDEKYVFLEVLKDAAGSKVSATYAYTVKTADSKTGVTVDLSFLKATAKQYLRAYGSSDMTKYSAIVTVNAQPAKLKMKFVEGKTDVKEAITNDKKALEDATKFSFKTQYGTVWQTLDKWDMTNAVVAGTTLIVRQDAVTTGDTAAPASAEAKVKVKAIAKAPKVTLDYVKDSISLKKDSEYRIISSVTGSTFDDDTKWVKVTEAAKKTPQELVDDYIKATSVTGDAAKSAAGGFILVMRTAKEGKAASQAVFFNVPAQQTATKEETSNKITVGENTLEWENCVNGIVFKSSKDKIFTYSVDEGKTWKAIKSNVTDGVLVKIDRSSEAVEVLLRATGMKAGKDTEAVRPSNTVTYELAKLTEAATPVKDTDVTVVRADSKVEITAKKDGLEYATNPKAKEWTALTKDNKVSVDAAGELTVYVRVKETADSKASDALEVKIAAPTPTPTPASK